MSSSADHYYAVPRHAGKSRGVAIGLALFFGGFGVHRFYLNRPGSGILYLIFFWSLIPGLIALFEIIIMLCLSNAEFDRRYNY